jgi:hypothetical protein
MFPNAWTARDWRKTCFGTCGDRLVSASPRGRISFLAILDRTYGPLIKSQLLYPWELNLGPPFHASSLKDHPLSNLGHKS